MCRCIYVLLTCALLACQTELSKTNNRTEIYEQVVSRIQDQYIFTEKLDGSWDRLLQNNKVEFADMESDVALFLAVDKLVQHLRDGHTNLFSPFDVSRSWNWFLDFPLLKDDNLLLNAYKQRYGKLYFNSRYWITEGFNHFIIVQDDIRVGYIEYTSFSRSVKSIRTVVDLMKSAKVKHLILDIRNNGGGSLENATELMSQLVSTPSPTYRIVDKHGIVHKTIQIQPEIEKKDELPVVVLTNRSSYSATNFFAGVTKAYPHLVLLGDKTGGGAGLGKSRYLNNGWLLRLSTTQIVDKNNRSWETGVEPDIYRNSAQKFELARHLGQDYLIEEAVNYFRQNP